MLLLLLFYKPNAATLKRDVDGYLLQGELLSIIILLFIRTIQRETTKVVWYMVLPHRMNIVKFEIRSCSASVVRFLSSLFFSATNFVRD